MKPAMRVLARRLVLLALFLCACSTGGPRPAGFQVADEGELYVACRSSEGVPLPGMTVGICPESSAGGPGAHGCRAAVCDGEGELVIRDLDPGSYFLRGELSGFADTLVGPLRVGEGSPIALKRVVVVLNPVCYDC